MSESDRKINLFAERAMKDYLASIREEMESYMMGESDRYILNVNEDEYIKHLADKFTARELLISFDKKELSYETRDIPAELFPVNAKVFSGKNYPRRVYKIHYPLKGNYKLLELTPENKIQWTKTVYLTPGDFFIEVVDFNNNAEAIKKEIADFENACKKQYVNVILELRDFNEGQIRYIKSKYEEAKNNALKKEQVLEQLDIPFKKENIPAPGLKTVAVEKPSAGSEKYEPQPAVSQTGYTDILKTSADIAEKISDKPWLTEKMEAAPIAKTFYTFLEASFLIEESSRVFTQNGDDINIRDEEHELFRLSLTEWNGKKEFLDSVTILLQHAELRNYKSALIFLTEADKAGKVSDLLPGLVKKHPLYTGEDEQRAEGWQSFKFKSPSNTDFPVFLSIYIMKA